jgi:hypothetical protein
MVALLPDDAARSRYPDNKRCVLHRFPSVSWIGCVPIRNGRFGFRPATDRAPSNQCFCCGQIPMRTQHCVDQLPIAIDAAVPIHPLALHRQMTFHHVPASLAAAACGANAPAPRVQTEPPNNEPSHWWRRRKALAGRRHWGDAVLSQPTKPVKP